MTATITVRMDNAAFADDGGGTELARILRRLADDLWGAPVERELTIRLVDLNGNMVGTFTTTN